ncbi:MAG: zinc-ribbon domain-containing protein [Lachnospiraceae bacterium]|nr:zinc-ribbon domain-containing protein [Lachnospiraceae bacterium]
MNEIRAQTLTEAYPDLLKEWHFKKNNRKNVSPYAEKSTSNRKVYRKCTKNPMHIFQMSIYFRTAGIRCPQCELEDVFAGGSYGE